MWTGGDLMQIAHLPFRGRLNHIGVTFKEFQRQQAIVIRRLFLGGDSQPLVIRVKTGQRRVGGGCLFSLPNRNDGGRLVIGS